MRFDLTDLRLFHAVVHAGSITHGAVEVGLSLPAASERLREMEASGGVALLTRGRRGVTPTEAGEMLVHHAGEILRQLAKMRGEIGKYAKLARASVRIFANTAAITEFLPTRLSPWMAQHPQIDIDLKERGSAEIARSIAAGFAEIGVLSNAVETTGLCLRPFATDRLVVVVPKGHPLADQARLRFADLLSWYFIGLTGGALQDHIESQALRLGAKLKMRIRLPSFHGVCVMVSAGAGIGIVPQTAARHWKRSLQITMIGLVEDWGTRHLSVCVRDKAELSLPAKDLFDHLAGDT